MNNKENLKINKINSYDFEWINKFKKTGIIESVDRNIVDSFIKNIFVDNEKGVDIFLDIVININWQKDIWKNKMMWYNIEEKRLILLKKF